MALLDDVNLNKPISFVLASYILERVYIRKNFRKVRQITGVRIYKMKRVLNREENLTRKNGLAIQELLKEAIRINTLKS